MIIFTVQTDAKDSCESFATQTTNEFHRRASAAFQESRWSAKTQKEARYHEGRAAAYRDCAAYLEAVTFIAKEK